MTKTAVKEEENKDEKSNIRNIDSDDRYAIDQWMQQECRCEHRTGGRTDPNDRYSQSIK